jgi:hypothetical protein
LERLRWGGWGADRGLEQRIYDADGRRGAARGHALDDAGGRRELPLAPERLDERGVALHVGLDAREFRGGLRAVRRGQRAGHAAEVGHRAVRAARGDGGAHEVVEELGVHFELVRPDLLVQLLRGNARSLKTLKKN